MRDLTELDRQIDNAEAHALDNAAKGRPWNQGSWFSSCGTYGCIAGNTALDAGWMPIAVHRISGLAIFSGSSFVVSPDGHAECDVADVAASLLGLDEDEAAAIFAGSNTIGVLRRLQKDLHDGRSIDADLAATYLEIEEQERVHGFAEEGS